MSSAATARRSASGECTASIASASLGPIPLAVCSSSNTFRSSSVPKPNRVSESSRTTSEVATRAGSPSLSDARVPGVHCTRSPKPPTSITAPSGLTPATLPLRCAITLSLQLRGLCLECLRLVLCSRLRLICQRLWLIGPRLRVAAWP